MEGKAQYLPIHGGADSRRNGNNLTHHLILYWSCKLLQSRRNARWNYWNPLCRFYSWRTWKSCGTFIKKFRTSTSLFIVEHTVHHFTAIVNVLLTAMLQVKPSVFWPLSKEFFRYARVLIFPASVIAQKMRSGCYSSSWNIVSLGMASRKGHGGGWLRTWPISRPLIIEFVPSISQDANWRK